jgi:hypothetical protein
VTVTVVELLPPPLPPSPLPSFELPLPLEFPPHPAIPTESRKTKHKRMKVMTTPS